MIIIKTDHSSCITILFYLAIYTLNCNYASELFLADVSHLLYDHKEIHVLLAMFMLIVKSDLMKKTTCFAFRT